MSLVITDKDIDDSYSGEVIRKAMAISPEIDEYVTTQQYLRETSEENLSPAWLRNKVLTIVLAQLDDRGIKFNIAESVALDDPLAVQAILVLRTKFDQDNLYDMFRAHQDVVDYVREVMDDSDCIGDIIDYCGKLFYLDDGWKALAEFEELKPGVIESASEFTDVIDEVLERVDRLGNPSNVSDYNNDVVVAYLTKLGKRKQDIVRAATAMYSSQASTESQAIVIADAKKVAVENYMQGFERELTRPNIIDRLDPDVHDININDIRSRYANKWPHVLNYWLLPEHITQVPSELVFSVMIATMYVDLGGTAAARTEIIRIFEDLGDILGTQYIKYREMLDNALTNLVMTDESGVK